MILKTFCLFYSKNLNIYLVIIDETGVEYITIDNYTIIILIVQCNLAIYCQNRNFSLFSSINLPNSLVTFIKSTLLVYHLPSILLIVPTSKPSQCTRNWSGLDITAYINTSRYWPSISPPYKIYFSIIIWLYRYNIGVYKLFRLFWIVSEDERLILHVQFFYYWIF